MSVHHDEQLPRGTVRGDGIRRRLQTVECVVAVCVGVEDATEVVVSLIGILLLVETWWDVRRVNLMCECIIAFFVVVPLLLLLLFLPFYILYVYIYFKTGTSQ